MAFEGWHQFRDPFKLKELCWPQYKFYGKQVEIVRSVWDNYKTVVPAGHKLGKDFITGFIAPAFFLTHHPCRIVTTSVDGSQLQAVLWGEMGRFIQTSRVPLEVERGGPLICNHLHIRKMWNGQIDKLSYILGRVAAKGEGLSGHHIAKEHRDDVFTLGIIDEASGVDKLIFEKIAEWAHRILIIGNPYDCANDFKWSVDGYPDGNDGGGDYRDPDSGKLIRKVIKITAEDSPNVRLAREEVAAGLKPTGDIIVPGVQPWDDYKLARNSWDPIKQCVGLDAEFYKGADVLMYPPVKMTVAGQLAAELDRRGNRRIAKAIGCDTGEGGAETAWYAIDEFGIIHEKALRTPDTADIIGITIALLRQFGVPAEMVMFDNGGGGHQAADYLKAKGYPCRTVRFGEPVTPPLKPHSITSVKKKAEEISVRYAYKSRRVQLYHRLSLRIMEERFAIPNSCVELRRQMKPIPLKYDDDGRMKLPPKGSDPDKKHTEKTLVELIGCSPDRLEALTIALHCMVTPTGRQKVRLR